ncbi:phospho-N-acetylmuramoyl-pentapeptide-transferase [bacterium]|jgi:phospho-N-acetylmuramoyl-pentapeptide-transferase|nr:phospho-N-acetylmuramoyl-pentapeptide-transferase [bacterium]
MFYHIFYPLREYFFGFNVFKYITFRASFAAVTSFLIAVCMGPFIIRRLKELKVGQPIRKVEGGVDLWGLHKDKEGTPTMGGVLIILSILISTVLWADVLNVYVITALFATLWLAAVGFIDDYLKLAYNSSKGLKSGFKFLFQVILCLLLGVFLMYWPQTRDNFTVITFPFIKLILNVGVFYIIFMVLVVAGSSNAVNLTDGLDGLAVGCIVIASVGYAIMSYITGHFEFAEYLQTPFINGTGELTVFCAAIAGAGMGFLWYNCPPAEVFMGDTGSLGLGGAIGIVAVLIKKEFLLIIIGGVFVIEALSVILQVGSYKTRKKRILLMTPIHHHFEMKGWKETKVTIRFWIIAIICLLLGLSTLKLR